MSDKSHYRDIKRIFSGFYKQKIALLILCSLSIILNMYLLYLLQGFIDVITANKNIGHIEKSFAWICLIGIISFIFDYFQMREWHRFRYTLMTYMRDYMYGRLLNKPPVFFRENDSGSIISAINNDGSIIAENIGINVIMLWLNFLRVTIILVVLIVKNIYLGLVALCCGGIYFAVILAINSKMRKSYMDYSKASALVSGVIEESSNAIFEIKSLNEKEYFRKSFSKNTLKLYKEKAYKYIGIQNISDAMGSFIGVFIPVFMVLLCGIFYVKGYVSLGMIILYYTYTQMLMEPLKNLGDYNVGKQQAMGAADRIYDFLSGEVDDVSEEKYNNDYGSLIQMDIDDFSYDDKNVLRDIHREFNEGDIVYVKGRSGSGKSTLFKLICGFIKPTAGRIMTFGKNVFDLSEEERFKYIKMQFQHPIILNASIRENIKLGLDYSDDEIILSLRESGLSELYDEHGLDYIIEENGANISGGQIQRLAFARIIIRKPKVMILDEITSGLDNHNRDLVLKTIEEFASQNKCVIFIASHDQYSKNICNKIIDLDQRVTQMLCE
jgi:ATP-binding cassette subfamily B protein